MRVAGTRVIAVEVDRGFVEGLNRCGEVREKVVKDVSNIFGLSNRQNKAAILLQGQNDSRAGWRQKTPGVWSWAGGVMLYVKHLMDVSNRHLGVRLTALQETGQALEMQFCNL